MTPFPPIRIALFVASIAGGLVVGGCEDDGPPPVRPGRCDAVPFGPENAPDTCSNGCDDDEDGLRDCADPDCTRVEPCPGSVACDGDPAPENTAEACSNGCSDDGDALVDCDDANCATTEPCRDRVDAGPAMLCPGPLEREDDPEACANGCSDDEDMLVDCRDPDCAGIGSCPGERMRSDRSRDVRFENTDGLCDDGFSNDLDDLVDCDDPDCFGRGGCGSPDGGGGGGSGDRQCPGGQIFRSENEFDRLGCTDGCSNDQDSLIDGCDPDCDGLAPCR
jgi:hypothetical protein